VLREGAALPRLSGMIAPSGDCSLATDGPHGSSGVGRSAGHCGVPKHISAACDSGQVPKDLQPANLLAVEILVTAEGQTDRVEVHLSQADGSGVITATVERNSMFMPSPCVRARSTIQLAFATRALRGSAGGC
jgi:hypothetical protein